jgi:hypothetical protein
MLAESEKFLGNSKTKAQQIDAKVSGQMFHGK